MTLIVNIETARLLHQTPMEVREAYGDLEFHCPTCCGTVLPISAARGVCTNCNVVHELVGLDCDFLPSCTDHHGGDAA